MSANPTLEDFIKNYIQSKAKSNTAESYEAWLSKNGIDSERIYADSIRDITGDYKRAKSEYGSLAESLGKLGLTASGYSDYLNGKAYSEMQRRKSGARDKYAENEAKNRQGYAKYLEERAESESSKYKSIIKSISDAGIMNYDDAYNYAVSAGLSGQAAEVAAQNASDIVRKKARENVLKTIISENFNTKQAREYALALGLSESEADELADYANKINRDSYYSSDYLDYLKNKWASQSGADK